MTQITAVLFDWDGVFVDSSHNIWKAYNHLHSIGLNSEYFEDKNEFLAWFDSNWKNNAPRMGLDTPEKLKRATSEYLTFYNALSHHEAFIHEMGRLAAFLYEKGIRMGVASNIDDSSKILSHVLEEVELMHVFDSLVGVDKSKHLKPHPACVNICLDEMGVKAENAIYIGDSPNDIIAGLEAGATFTIGVAWGFSSKEELHTAGAHFVANTVDELHDILVNLVGL